MADVGGLKNVADRDGESAAELRRLVDGEAFARRSADPSADVGASSVTEFRDPVLAETPAPLARFLLHAGTRDQRLAVGPAHLEQAVELHEDHVQRLDGTVLVANRGNGEILVAGRDVLAHVFSL